MVDGPPGIGGGRNDNQEEEPAPEGEPSPLGAAATLTVRRQRERGPEGADGLPVRRFPRLSLGKRLIAIVVVILLLALMPAFISGLKKTPKNMIGISYGGGPIESAHFQRVVKPGSSLFFNGWFDNLYLYPADQRNYIISRDPGTGDVQGSDAILAPTSDRVQLTYQLAVYFKLNTDLLRQFHEQLGLRYQAYTASGWNNMLRDTFRQNVENSVQEQTRRYTVAQLYGNAQSLADLQKAEQASLGRRLVAALGAPYFCSPTFKPGGPCDPPTFIVKQIDIPQTVADAFVNERAAQVQVAQRKAEAEGIAELNKQLAIAGQNYVLLKAIESGKVTFWVVPSDSGLALTTPPNGTGSPNPTTTPNGTGSPNPTTPSAPGEPGPSSTTTTTTGG
jgi:hypothetical protein